MSNNIFSGKRLQLLFKQHFIHNSQFLLLSAVAYIGVIFIVLCLTQAGNDLKPHDLANFQAAMVGLVSVFGILYVGHSFPAFRSKESSIHYLMLPASALEKFTFEFIIRIVLALVILPLLYWVTFNMQGYFFGIFTEEAFEPIGIQYTVLIDEDVPEDFQFLIYCVITGGVFFVLSLVFTGSAMFDKQPLVKSLFTVAVVVMFFGLYSYVVVEHLGFGRYNPPDFMFTVPLEERSALTAVSIALFAATIVMLFVAFRKLKEREV
jgi:hypothetical protein